MGDENAPDPPMKSQANGGDLGGFVRGREGGGAKHGEEDEWGRRVVVGPTNQPLPTLSRTQDPTARGYGGRLQ